MIDLLGWILSRSGEGEREREREREVPLTIYRDPGDKQG